MTTEERPETLERELARANPACRPAGRRRNRRLPAAARLVAGAFALVCIVAGAGCSVIRANTFVLEDKNGHPRAILALVDGGPTLSLFDENEKPRAMLALVDSEPTLTLLDENRKHRAVLSLIDGNPLLLLRDENGMPGATLGVIKHMPALLLLDENGKLKWAAP